MSDADNQTGGSGDRFSKEDQDKRQRPSQKTGKDEHRAREAARERP